MFALNSPCFIVSTTCRTIAALVCANAARGYSLDSSLSSGFISAASRFDTAAALRAFGALRRLLVSVGLGDCDMGSAFETRPHEFRDLRAQKIFLALRDAINGE